MHLFPLAALGSLNLFLFAGLLLPRDAFSSVCVYWPISAAAGPADLMVMVYFYHRETVNSEVFIRTCCISSISLLSIKPITIKLLLSTVILFPRSYLFHFWWAHGTTWRFLPKLIRSWLLSSVPFSVLHGGVAILQAQCGGSHQSAA